MTVIEYLEDTHTRNAIVELLQNNMVLYNGINSVQKIDNLTAVLYNQFVQECVKNNQYISLSNQSIQNSTVIYHDLIISLCALVKKAYTRNDIEQIVIEHRRRLICELHNNVYHDRNNQIYIPCAEYTPDFQEKILRIGSRNLLEPVLDIGCGEKYGLVRSLREQGYGQVYGLDQYTSSVPFIFCGNWFEFQFEPDAYGTIIAHMSFTNHFRRSLLAGDDKKQLYEDTYCQILDSLKPDGVFIYTPAVRKIERILDKNRFQVTYLPNTQDQNLDTVIIRKKESEGHSK